MSKKRAIDYRLEYISNSRPYVRMDFIDKKGRVMLSSVEVLLNSDYLSDEGGDWNYAALNGFVRTR